MEEERRTQQLRSKAAELFLRKEWKESVEAYSHFISCCQEQISRNTRQNPNPNHLSNLKKSLCLALSNRAEAWSQLRNFTEALTDCEQALEIESAHFKTLLCKGKILLSLNLYGMALYCFKLALLDRQSTSDFESINGYLQKCKKLELSYRTGAFDLSDWVLKGFRGNPPEISEYIGAVEIKKSQIGWGRGLFATKSIDCGILFLVTKAVAIERSIMPNSKDERLGGNQLVMWKNLIDKVLELSRKCRRTHQLISRLSTGEEDTLEVPHVGLFRPEAVESGFSNENLDMDRLLKILDVNSLVEDAVSSNVLGKNSGYYGVGLWLLPSFINHSCTPNARRLHVGDYMMVHASRDIKAGEEITFGYFDVLSPLSNRREMAKIWGFDCSCKRCKFEEGLLGKQEMRELEMGCTIGRRGVEVEVMVYRLEECMRRLNARGKEIGYLRASFWGLYSEAFESEKTMRRWGRRNPEMEAVVDSVVEAVGSDERILKVVKEGLKRNGGGGTVQMERAIKLGRGVYGKVMKKQATRTLLELSA